MSTEDLNLEHPTVLSPLQIGDLKLKNRVVFAPLTRGRTGSTRIPNDLIGEYYKQRSGAGLIISEATAISELGYGFFGSPGIYTKEMIEGWKPITKAVRDNGSAIFCQLWHMGRQSEVSFHPGQPNVAPSAIKVGGPKKPRNADAQTVDHTVPRALETDEIPGVVKEYQQAAINAIEAGFDGVEIHGANGYLVDEFLQCASNQRTDKYGGSWENRARFLEEVIQAIIAHVPANRVGLRISPNGGFGDMGAHENKKFFPWLIKRIAKYNLAYLHVMDGLEFGSHRKSAPVTMYEIKSSLEAGLAESLTEEEKDKRASDRHNISSWALMNNVALTKDMANGMIRGGVVDFCSFGRPFISNPDLVERFEKNYPLAPVPPFTTFYNNDKDPYTNLAGYADYPSYNADI